MKSIEKENVASSGQTVSVIEAEHTQDWAYRLSRCQTRGMDDATLTALVQQVAKREWGEDEETRENTLRQFRDWILKNPNIRGCRTDDIFLLGFLRSKKFSIIRAQESLLKFLELCQNVPKFTANIDVLESKIDAFVSSGFLYTSPFPDDEGRTVSIQFPNAVNPSEHSYVDHGRTFFSTMCHMMNNPASQVLGMVHIVDLSNIGTAHITFWPPLELLGLLQLFEQVVPLKHKEVHMVNMSPVVKVFINTIRFALSKKIQDRFHMHDTFEDLHKMVNPKVLPKKYGGEMSDIEMNELWKKQLLESRELVMSMSDMRVVLDKAATDIELGSFRKLAID